MQQFTQLTVTGLTNGVILALAALGFVLIYKASGVINFAQGEALLIGAYVVYAMVAQVGLHWSVGIGVAVVVAAALGIAVERFVLRPLVGQPTISVIMVTIGLAEVLGSVVQVVWGTSPRGFPQFIPGGTVNVAGATLPVDRIVAIAVAAVVLAAFMVFFQRSRDGVAMRAVADDQQAALTMGISVRRVLALSWALAGVSAVVAGMLIANIVGVSGGLSAFGLTVFPVVIVGGLDSLPGAMAGGLIIGLLTTYTGGYVGSGLSTVIPYLLLTVILLVRPYGLFGEARIERV